MPFTDTEWQCLSMGESVSVLVGYIKVVKVATGSFVICHRGRTHYPVAKQQYFIKKNFGQEERAGEESSKFTKGKRGRSAPMNRDAGSHLLKTKQRGFKGALEK